MRSRLNDKLNFQVQTILRNQIEVPGVTVAQNENPYYTILVMSSLIGVRPTDSDIDYVQRACPRRSDSHFL